MPQFLDRFPEVSSTYSGGGFYKGLMTGMIELGALIGEHSENTLHIRMLIIVFVGALNQGWIADKISRKHSIFVAVCVFTVGSTLQVAARDYAMLVVARFIGGLGIGGWVMGYCFAPSVWLTLLQA